MQTIKERELLEKEEEESYDRQQQRLALRKVRSILACRPNHPSCFESPSAGGPEYTLGSP